MANIVPGGTRLVAIILPPPMYRHTDTRTIVIAPSFRSDENCRLMMSEQR